MSEESHAAKRLRSSHQMSKGSSGNRVNSSDGSIYQAPADAPPDRKVSKARRPSALQADAAHDIALPAATCFKFDAAAPASAVAPADTAAAAAEPSHTFPNPVAPCAAASNTPAHPAAYADTAAADLTAPAADSDDDDVVCLNSPPSPVQSLKSCPV